MEGTLTCLVVFLGIFALTSSQSFDDSVQQFQTPQQFSQQGRFQQPQGQKFQFQNTENFNGQQSFNKAPDAGRISNQRLRRPQVKPPAPIGSIPAPAPPPPPRASQPFRQQPQFVPVPVQKQPVRQEFFDQPPVSFSAPPPPPPPPQPQPQPQPQPEFVSRPVAPPTRFVEPFSTTKKSQKELEEEYNIALLKHQAENAHYTFAASVSDGINDNEQLREEVRDGLKVSGKYSYSDGFFKRTITYEADENGYRVVNEEIEPLGDGPQQDPDGMAQVKSNVGGSDLRYTITSADIVDRKPHQPVPHAQTQQVFPSRQTHQQAVEDSRPFTPSQPAFGRQQQFQGSQQFQDSQQF